MPRTADDLYQEALQLPETDRCHLADLLEASVDSASVEQAWIEEASRRFGAIEQGQSTLVNWNDVKQQLQHKNRT